MKSRTQKIYESIPNEFSQDSKKELLPVLPLNNLVAYPSTSIPVVVGRNFSVKAVNKSMYEGKNVLLVPQKIETDDLEPLVSELFEYGALGKIRGILRLPGNMMKVRVDCFEVVKINKFTQSESIIEGSYTILKINRDIDNNVKFNALHDRTIEVFRKYLSTVEGITDELFYEFINNDDLLAQAYIIASNIETTQDEKLELLTIQNLYDLYFKLYEILYNLNQVFYYKNELNEKLDTKMQEYHRKMMIREQIQFLRDELGDESLEIAATPEIMELKKNIENKSFTEIAKAKANETLQKLSRYSSYNPDYSVERDYLEMLLELPWIDKTEDNLNIDEVAQILDEDHYDLAKPKERILDFIAVLNLAEKTKRQILCFVGPPGTGKTSLGKSIARAMGRKFIRISLGGIRDEAEIRGHRRTYIGAMPGKIISAMKRAGTTNPVIMLDEIDKLSTSFQGDPASALLEVLDPEQNSTFTDHYLEIEYDLSNVLFITTANVMYDIPQPLLDRMEVIEISSYLDFQKLEIAKNHIIPRLLEELNIKRDKIKFTDEAILKIINGYTREAGVRELERQISTVLRKYVRRMLSEFNAMKLQTQSKKTTTFADMMKRKKLTIDVDDVYTFLKGEKYHKLSDNKKSQIGVANGLAWTSVGGEILPIEVSIMQGNQKLLLTGKLGDVMKESAMAALSFIRSNADNFNIRNEFFRDNEIHLHIPEGAVPKDGPSAGITMGIAMLSAITRTPVRRDLAMTGEITLRGNILPIGGLREKLLAAKRYGVRTVLIPKENEKDLDEISDFIKDGLEIILIVNIMDAIPIALEKQKEVVVMGK
ncbi:MAG TPA: endopeptidase La [Candidatus Kapabacteria bacterium]|nr:endopeptidase La [Candidatus Kapabacteria bacterium]